MAASFEPLEMMRRLYHSRVYPLWWVTSRLERISPALLRLGILAVRGLVLMLRPLKRMKKLVPVHLRMAIEMGSGQSMNTDVLWTLTSANKAMKRYLEGIFDCAENSTRPVVWIEWCLPPDLIMAFDAQPCCTEALVAMLYFSGPDEAEMLIDVAEQAGVPVEYCSSSKNGVGACLANQLPQPDCIVTPSHPCDSMVSSYQTIQYLTGVPTFLLDTPYWDDARSLDYYTGEVQRLISFLEEHLDRKLDYDRLREVIEEVNKTNELVMEVNEMYRARPCPGSVWPSILTWAIKTIGLGTPEYTEMVRRLHAIVRKRYQAGKGMLKREKIRVIWFDVPIIFYPVVTWMEETFGATVVMDLLSYSNNAPIDTSTPESMVRGLANSYMNMTMARQFRGPVDYYMNDVRKLCEEYDGDCFIYTGHVGCKHGWASTGLLREYMERIGMPILILSSDVFDQRVTHEDQIKAQIEDFFVSKGLAA